MSLLIVFCPAALVSCITEHIAQLNWRGYRLHRRQRRDRAHRMATMIGA